MDEHTTDLTEHLDHGNAARPSSAAAHAIANGRLTKAMELEAIARDAELRAADLADASVRRSLLNVLQAQRGAARRLEASEETWALLERLLADDEARAARAAAARG